ncbi:DUF1971 domain-containing protein [Commensalibacter oyaizuii]|uniref:DUF1971 domain-containing protein n=1 Tax=Commensalibacter oyaizuii TaxID=3043873 RepID=A0ABT6Q2M7_9PROT|nr:DUF1971 domain-containing protein [Commensalibacter sp. TBRC 16381]MDI2091385.1 DUF1971 domain-containing protein [Commensalibacter sp. TBRC 16381]
MTEQSQDLICYKTLQIWTPSTLPEAFKVCHNTKSGVWAKLHIISGSIEMEFLSDDGKQVIQKCRYSVDHQPDFISPRQYHRIAGWSDDMKCQLSFYSRVDAK